jgi:hypothetical protein
MKKILILVMSCQDEFFKQQVEKIKETWAKPILEGKYPNMDFIVYEGGYDNHSYDKENHILKVRCEDDLDNTFKKTYYAFSLMNSNVKYDYIFRTNTSTYVNVDLLDKFIQSLEDYNVVYTSELYSLVESNVPYPLYLYGRGNGLILSKKVVNVLLKEGISFLYEERVDDVAIGNVLNTYWIKQGKNYLDFIKGYRHGWFRAITSIETHSGHSICEFSCSNEDPNFWKSFITIQTKMYRQRGEEDENHNRLYSIIKNITSNEDDVKLNHEYSQNPDVFVGSCLGYISYANWVNVKKQLLWNLECANKADDDINKTKYLNKIWY